MDYTAQGHTVGLAVRMEQLAETRSIYLTEHTASSLGATSRCASSIKGVSEPPRRQRPPLMAELGGSNAFDYQDRYESLES
jgi:class 3 adenylate cyclase